MHPQGKDQRRLPRRESGKASLARRDGITYNITIKKNGMLAPAHLPSRLPDSHCQPFILHWSQVDNIPMNHLAFLADGSQGTELNSIAEQRLFSLLLAPRSPVSERRGLGLMSPQLVVLSSHPRDERRCQARGNWRG